MLSIPKKKLIIYDSKDLVNLMRGKGVLAFTTFKDYPIFLKMVRKIFLNLNLPLGLWFAKWKFCLKDIDTVIIFAKKILYPLPYIHKKYPDIKIIVWYWNPVFKCVSPSLLPDEVEKWSFDKTDCENYGLKYNTTFYFDNISLTSDEVKYDICFIGTDKGRKSALIDINKKFNQLGIKTYFYIVDEKEINNNRNKKKGPLISYSKYLNIISQSKVIFDFVQDGQYGLTLRPMESIFFKKKLITNNKEIKIEDFYHPSNIFIIGLDDDIKIKEFINSPYYPISDEIVKRYDLCNWLDRFFN